MIQPKVLIVCVEYDDLLSLTLPRTRQHFENVTIITSHADRKTKRVALKYGADVIVTNAFYENGCPFNKGAAMEQGFDTVGRDGWILILDADIVLPVDLTLDNLDTTCLYTPHRRMLRDPWHFFDGLDWSEMPIAPDGEHAGFFQLFNASTPFLRQKPWYTSWKHAGGCDSDFQARFPPAKKIWLPFTVLHLGEDGRNWCGRVSPRLDGSVPENAAERNKQLAWFMSQRPLHGYSHERL